MTKLLTHIYFHLPVLKDGQSPSLSLGLAAGKPASEFEIPESQVDLITLHYRRSDNWLLAITMADRHGNNLLKTFDSPIAYETYSISLREGEKLVGMLAWTNGTNHALYMDF